MLFADVPANCMDAERSPIRVEVAYALPRKQILIALDVPEGCTVFDAMLRSDIQTHVEGLDLAAAEVGVFGRRVEDPRRQVLSDGDRVEIYRPLLVDPRESRRRRAKSRSSRA
jgi:hypothetical protein